MSYETCDEFDRLVESAGYDHACIMVGAARDMLDALRAIATEAGLTKRAFPNAPGRDDWSTVERIAHDAIAKAMP